MIDKTKVEAAIKKHFGDEIKVMFTEKVKNNDIKYGGVTVCRPDEKMSPSFTYDDEDSTEDVINRIVENYQRAIDTAPKGLDVDITKEFVLDNVFPMVCNREKNLFRLKDSVHDKFLDLEVAYRCKMDNEDYISSFEISKSLCEYLKISEDELREAALGNAEPVGFQFLGMRGITNASKTYGAGVIVNSEGMYRLWEMMIITSFRQAWMKF